MKSQWIIQKSICQTKIDDCSYTVITVMDINNPDKFYDQTAIAGNVQNVYVSENNIYLIDDEYEEIDISDTKKRQEYTKKRKILENCRNPKKICQPRK